MSQTSFSHNFTNTYMISMEDLSNDAQNVSKQSVLIEISVNQCQTLISRYLENHQMQMFAFICTWKLSSIHF